MAITSRHNPSDRSKDRTSLLIQLLLAEGPGTIIWKRYANDCVYDRTSHDLLRSVLTSYSFLPCPNAHFVAEAKEDLQRLHALLENPQGELSRIYAKYSVPGREHIRLLNDLANEGTGTPYFDRIRKQYYVSQTGPVVICGSPEAYYGYRKLDDREETDRSELEILLDECGYSGQFAIDVDWNTTRNSRIELLSCRNQDGGNYCVEQGYEDLGLIHVGRTTRNQLVVILAGVADDYGTYGSIRMALDSGRNEINSGILDFFQTPKKPFTMISQLRPWTKESLNYSGFPDWREEPLIYYPGTPVDAKVVYSTSNTDCSVFEISRWEQKLANRAPAKPTLRKESTRLAEYFAEIGPISAMVKAYPGQIQDDANAKDLLEYLLPDTHFIPALGNAPRDRDIRKYLREYFDGNFEATNAEDKTFLSLLEKVDECGANLIRSWVSIAKQYPTEIDSSYAITNAIDETGLAYEKALSEDSTSSQSSNRHSGAQIATSTSFFDFCLSNYRIDTKPLVILGSPESYLGYLGDSNISEDGSHLQDCSSQLSEIVESINYPNRYVQQWSKNSSTILDRSLVASYPPLLDLGHDYGIVYLNRDPSNRIVLVIAGGTSRGTEAGLQLLFEERRANIDEAVQRFIEGKQNSLELAYRCQPARIGSRYVVEVLTEDLLNEFRVNRRSLPFVDRMLAAIESKSSKDIKIDSRNDWKIVAKNDSLQLKVQSKKLFINKQGNTHLKYGFFLSDIAFKTIEKISKLSKDERLTVLLLGETGTGKEGLGYLIHAVTRINKPFFYFNASRFTSTIIDAQIFGVKKGKAADAVDSLGFFEKFDGGTVVLDELTLTSSHFQVSMNHVLESGEYNRVGDETNVQRTTANIVISTNFAKDRADFESQMATHGQRGDFGARCKDTISVWPLRARFPEILPVFVNNIYSKVSTNPNAEDRKVFISIEAIVLLLIRPYEKNFRELRIITGNIAKAFKNSNDRNNPIRKRDILLAFDINPDVAVPSRKHSNRDNDFIRDTSPVVELFLEYEEENPLNVEGKLEYEEDNLPNIEGGCFFGPPPSFEPPKKEKIEWLNQFPFLGHFNNPDPFEEIAKRLASLKNLLAERGDSPSRNQITVRNLQHQFETQTLNSNGDLIAGSPQDLPAHCQAVFDGLRILYSKKQTKCSIHPPEFFSLFLSVVLRTYDFDLVNQNRYEECIRKRKERMTSQSAKEILDKFFDKNSGNKGPKDYFRKCSFLLVTGYWPAD